MSDLFNPSICIIKINNPGYQRFFNSVIHFTVCGSVLPKTSYLYLMVWSVSTLGVMLLISMAQLIRLSVKLAGTFLNAELV